MKEQKKETSEQRTCKTETISTLAVQYFQSLRSSSTVVPTAALS